MPISYSFSDNILILSKEGKSTHQEFIDAFDNAMNDPSCPAGVELLIDGRNDELLPTTEEIRKSSSYFATFGDRLGKRALVASSDLLFGLGRMAEAIEGFQDKEMQVFKDYDEAMAWLSEKKKESS